MASNTLSVLCLCGQLLTAWISPPCKLLCLLVAWGSCIAISQTGSLSSHQDIWLPFCGRRESHLWTSNSLGLSNRYEMVSGGNQRFHIHISVRGDLKPDFYSQVLEARGLRSQCTPAEGSEPSCLKFLWLPAFLWLVEKSPFLSFIKSPFLSLIETLIDHPGWPCLEILTLMNL